VEVRYLPSWAGTGDVRDLARQALAKRRREEYRRGTSLSGPHRDDLEVTLDGISLRSFGSRGQQRAVVVGLRLAESAVVRTDVGEDPILLFDDVLADLDRERGARLVEITSGVEQVILTATDRIGVAGDAHVVALGGAR
jgi:DNA replication and repair protein RecF